MNSKNSHTMNNNCFEITKFWDDDRINRMELIVLEYMVYFSIRSVNYSAIESM